MLEVRAYRDGENEVVVDGNIEGRSNECCAELCEVFDVVLKGIAENEDPHVAEKLELVTVATIVAAFIGRKTGKLDDNIFMQGMLDATTKFLHGNIFVNSQEGREKVIELLENLVAKGKKKQPDCEAEQPDGDSDGEE